MAQFTQELLTIEGRFGGQIFTIEKQETFENPTHDPALQPHYSVGTQNGIHVGTIKKELDGTFTALASGWYGFVGLATLEYAVYALEQIARSVTNVLEVEQIEIDN